MATRDLVRDRARNLFSKAIASPSAQFQASGVLLMFFQSFLVPYIIGVAPFGAQMLFLAPVFLAQALLEPSYQAEMNAAGTDGKSSINLSSIGSQALILMGFAIPFSVGPYSTRLLVLLAAGYCTFTALQAAAFAIRDVRLAAVSRHVALVTYLITFTGAVWVNAHGEIIWAHAVSLLVASAYTGLALAKKNVLTVRFGGIAIAPLLGGLTFRLPTISFSSLATILLGYAGAPMAMIGEFRIFLSAINAGRYFNAVPLPRLQTAIHRYFAVGDRALTRLSRLYLVSFAVFAITLTVLFPIAYATTFGEPTFGRLSLAFASTFILVQPLSYVIYSSRSDAAAFNVTLSVGVSAATAWMFYLLFKMSGNAGLSASASIATLTVIYSAVSYFTARSKRHAEASPIRRFPDNMSSGFRSG